MYSYPSASLPEVVGRYECNTILPPNAGHVCWIFEYNAKQTSAKCDLRSAVWSWSAKTNSVFSSFISQPPPAVLLLLDRSVVWAREGRRQRIVKEV
jgi:hypothetical protein